MCHLLHRVGDDVISIDTVMDGVLLMVTVSTGK